ncbi:MAG: hypothetical protein WCR97_02990 [Bacilli bacterium]
MRKKITLSTFGSIVCAVNVIIILIQFLFGVFINNTIAMDSAGIYTILNYLISVVFYIIVATSFSRGKDNFFFNYRALLILIISDYVFPFVYNLLIGSINFITTGPTAIISSLISSLGLALGIVYFIFLILETKNRKKSYGITLFVFGIIMMCFALIDLGFTLYSLISSFIALTSYTPLVIFAFIVNIVASFVSCGFSVIYFLYAKELKEIRGY